MSDVSLPTPRLRVGLVGAGYISEFHVSAIRRVPGAQIVGVADVSSSRAIDLAARHNLPNIFGTMDQMIDQGVDVVHVLTPPSSHASLTIGALKRGCHVLVEKPLAMNVEEIDAISSAAIASGRSVCVNHSLLYDRFVVKALKLVRSGAIGTPLTFDFFRSSDYPPYRGGALPIHYREGGYPFLDQGVHALYLAEEFLGPVQDVQAHYGTHGGDANLLFDEWRVMARCDRGTANFHISWNVQPLQNWFVVQGTQGVIRANLFAMWVTCNRKLPLTKAPARALNAIGEGISISKQVPANIFRVATKKIVQYGGLHSLIAEFYRRLRSGEEVPVAPQRARSTVYWTSRVSQQADAAKIKWEAQFQTSGTAKVLVTGATGLIGRHLVRRLLQKGVPIRILVRRTPPDELINRRGVEIFQGDLGDPAAVDRAVARTEIVYHVGATMRGGEADHERGTVCGTQNIVDSVLRHNVQRLVYISSLSCLHAVAPRARSVVTEAWPIEPHPEKRGAYTQAKTRAEKIVTDAVRDHDLPAIILRPGRVSCPESEMLTPEVAQRLGDSLIVLGNGNRALPLVQVEDVVDGICFAAEKGKFDGRIIHLVDPAVCTQNDVIREYLRTATESAKVIHVPTFVFYSLAGCIQLAFKMLGRPAPLSVYRLRSALARLQFDCSRAKLELGWCPHFGPLLRPADTASNNVAMATRPPHNADETIESCAVADPAER